jgi:hypothetical protein
MDADERKRIALENRRRMPAVAKILDEFRAQFGDGVRLINERDETTGYEIREGWTHARPIQDSSDKPRQND